MDGNGTSDLAVFWPETGKWYVMTTGDWATYNGGPIVWGKQIHAGEPWAVPSLGDYDADQRADLTVTFPLPGQWHVRKSSTGTSLIPGGTVWGKQTIPGDPNAIPVAADYDGDGRTDMAVFFPSTGRWHILQSSTWTELVGGGIQWGWSGVIPVPDDYNGDNKADLAVFDPAGGRWHILLTGTWTTLGPPTGIQFGWSATTPAPGDYDQDGKTDIAVYWPGGGQWYVLESSTWALRTVAWPAASSVAVGNIPVPGDYNGDARSDFAVFQPSTGLWHIWLNGPEEALGGGPIQWGWSETDPVR